MAYFGCAGKIGDEFYELQQIRPDYPGGLRGPCVRLEIVFRQVPESEYVASFDTLFRGAFSPWPPERSTLLGDRLM